MNGRIILLTLLFITFSVRSALQITAPRTNSPEDVLLFLDGSMLHGRLDQIEPGKALLWNYPDALQAMRLKPSNIERIRFSKPKSTTNQVPGLCRFRFQNGDEVFGKALSMQGTDVEIETSIAGKINADRNSLSSMAFLSKGLSTLYEGPNGMDEWQIAKGPNTWQFRDGTLMANGPGVIGRNMKLSGSSSIELDLGWTGQFNMILILYTDVLDRFDYSTHCYVFYIGAGYINAQRIQGGVGALNLGHVQIQSMLQKNKMHFEIRANKEDSTISLYADGVMVQKWRDSAGFVAKGSGMVLSSNIGSPRVSNIRVSEWDTKVDPDAATNVSTSKFDTVFLVNRDKVSGTVKGFQNSKIQLTTEETALEIPIERVTQVTFAQVDKKPVTGDPWDVRATFTGGGAVTFRLEQWGNALTGSSPTLGKLAFSPDTLQQLQFNLSQTRASSAVEELNEQSSLDFNE